MKNIERLLTKRKKIISLINFAQIITFLLLLIGPILTFIIINNNSFNIGIKILITISSIFFFIFLDLTNLRFTNFLFKINLKKLINEEQQLGSIYMYNPKFEKSSNLFEPYIEINTNTKKIKTSNKYKYFISFNPYPFDSTIKATFEIDKEHYNKYKKLMDDYYSKEKRTNAFIIKGNTNLFSGKLNFSWRPFAIKSWGKIVCILDYI